MITCRPRVAVHHQRVPVLLRVDRVQAHGEVGVASEGRGVVKVGQVDPQLVATGAGQGVDPLEACRQQVSQSVSSVWLQRHHQDTVCVRLSV